MICDFVTRYIKINDDGSVVEVGTSGRHRLARIIKTSDGEHIPFHKLEIINLDEQPAQPEEDVG